MLSNRVDLDNTTQTIDYFQKILDWLFGLIEFGEGLKESSLAREYYRFLLALDEKNNTTTKKQRPVLLYCLTLFEAHGIGCNQNIESAKHHFDKLKRLANDPQLPLYDSLYAKHYLAILLTWNIPDISEQDYEKSAALLIESAPLMLTLNGLNRLRKLKALSASACYKVGNILEKGCASTNNEPNIEQAIVFYKAGVEKSDSNCAFALAKLYGEGKKIKKDLAKQAEYLVLAFKLAGNRALQGEVDILKELLRKKPDAAVLMALIEIAHLQNSSENKEQYIELLKKQNPSREARFALATMEQKGLFDTKVNVEAAARNFYSCISQSSKIIDALEQKAFDNFIEIATTQQDLSSEIYLNAGNIFRLKSKPRNLELILQCYTNSKSAAGAWEAALVTEEQRNLAETLKWLLKVGKWDLRNSNLRITAGKKLEKLSSQYPLRTNTRESVDVAIACIRFLMTHDNFAVFFLERIKLRLNELSILANSHHLNAAYAAFEIAKVLEELPQNSFASPVDYYVQAFERSDEGLHKAAVTHCLIELAKKNSKAVVALNRINLSEHFQPALRSATEANMMRIMQALASIPEQPLRIVVEQLSQLKLNDLTAPMPEDLLRNSFQTLNERQNQLEKLYRSYLDSLSANLNHYMQMNKPEIVNRQEGVQELIKILNQNKNTKDLLELLNAIKKIEALLIKKNSERKNRTVEVKVFYAQQLAFVQEFLDKTLQESLQIEEPSTAKNVLPEAETTQTDAVNSEVNSLLDLLQHVVPIPVPSPCSTANIQLHLLMPSFGSNFAVPNCSALFETKPFDYFEMIVANSKAVVAETRDQAPQAPVAIQLVSLFASPVTRKASEPSAVFNPDVDLISFEPLPEFPAVPTEEPSHSVANESPALTRRLSPTHSSN